MKKIALFLAAGAMSLGLRVASASAGGVVEVKVQVDPDQTSLIDPSKDGKEKRKIYYYDTAALDFYKKGVIMRGRVKEDGEDDFTVKIRPLDEGNPPPDFVANLRNMPGITCESDQVIGQAAVESCELKSKVEKNRVGEKDAAKLFSKEQLQLIDMMGFKKLPDLSELKALGPTKAHVWEHKNKCLDKTLSVEVWTLPEKTIAEISTRFDMSERGYEKTFVNCIKDEGINTDHPQAMKTREALEAFSHD